MTSPAIPRISASLLVLAPRTQPNSPGFSVLMVQRPLKGENMAQAHVFPGGMHEDDDSSKEYCAVRELFEETGMLLGLPWHDTLSEQDGLAGHIDLNEDEVRSLRPLGFHGALKKLGARPSIVNLRPWAHWVTPKYLKRRYDTMFYLTAVTEKGCTLPDNSETIGIDWFEPKQALQLARENQINLAPPQFYILHDLARFKTVDDVLNYSEGLTITTMQPDVRPDPTGYTIILPGDCCYENNKDLTTKGPRHRLIREQTSNPQKLNTSSWIIQKTGSTL